MTTSRSTRLGEAGITNLWMIVAICFIVVAVATGVASGWAMVHYFNEKQTVDTQVDTAVASAKKTQADGDAAKFAAQEKLPYRTFVGPDDYGQLQFNYPKTWSLYVDQDGTSNGETYAAYLNPVAVPPVSNSAAAQQFAVRVLIEQKDYDTVLTSYSSLVKKGTLTSSSVTVNGEQGTRLDGNFTANIRGSAVIFKIRDKTVTVRTDADTFDTDFNALIQTIKFNS